jgi:hypothetical protein
MGPVFQQGLDDECGGDPRFGPGGWEAAMQRNPRENGQMWKPRLGKENTDFGPILTRRRLESGEAELVEGIVDLLYREVTSDGL